MKDRNITFANTGIRYSIIIPHYNIPLLLERLLNTIPEREDIQIIIVDDCSPDCNTYLKRYAFLNRNNVEFYITDRNGGGGYARNKGLEHAKGKWLLFADADDFFADGFSSVLDKYYHAEEDIIFFQIRSLYSDNLSRESERATNRIRKYKKIMDSKDNNGLRYNFIEPWAKMIKRKMVESHKIQFDETNIANDYFFSIKTGYYAQQVKAAPEITYLLTQRKGSVSGGGWTDSPENMQTRLQVITRAQAFLQDKGIILTPMPIRGLMVLALKHYPTLFLKELHRISKQNISISQLLFQMLFYALPHKRSESLLYVPKTKNNET